MEIPQSISDLVWEYERISYPKPVECSDDGYYPEDYETVVGGDINRD